jgi:hypothetical protein
MISRHSRKKNLSYLPWGQTLHLMKLETGLALQHSYLIAAMRISKWLCMTLDTDSTSAIELSMRHLNGEPFVSHQRFLRTVRQQESLLPESGSDTRALCDELFYVKGLLN